MSYAEPADLKARSGRLATAWTETSAPGLSDLDRFLDDAAAQIDAVLSQWSVSSPVTGVAADALRPLNAKIAAIDALQATFPSAQGPNEARELIDSLRAQVYGSNGTGGEWGALVGGKHPAVTVLIQTGAIPEASSFWTNEPDYGRYPVSPEEAIDANPMMLPRWSRLSRF